MVAQGFANFLTQPCARPSADTIGPMTRTVRDAAILLDLMVGYDRNDPATALGLGKIPDTDTSSLHVDGLRGARIGVIREPMNANTNPKADDYGLVRWMLSGAKKSRRRVQVARGPHLSAAHAGPGAVRVRSRPCDIRREVP